MTIDQRTLAASLLRIGAVAVNPEQPFTWASGMKSPVYCDNRLTLGHPDVRAAVRDGFEAILSEERIRPDVIVGTATAGIPHAAWLADRLTLPLAYVRSKAKEHGKQNKIEGLVKSGWTAVVVEDLISTGGSSLSVVEALRETGIDVRILLSIFTYGLPSATEAFRDARVPTVSLVTFDVLIDVAREQGMLKQESLETLHDWRKDPRAWSEAQGV